MSTFVLLSDDTYSDIRSKLIDPWFSGYYSISSRHTPLACYQFNIIFQIDITRNSWYLEYNKIALLAIFLKL
jgi:hypothetical protein